MFDRHPSAIEYPSESRIFSDALSV